MSSSWHPGERALLDAIERHAEAEDPRFAAGFVSLRPCAPREYRSRTRRRVVALTAGVAVVLGVVLVTWFWLGWFVAVLFGMESAGMAALVAAGPGSADDGPEI